MAFLQRHETMASDPPTGQSSPGPPQPSRPYSRFDDFTSSRSRRQLGLFAAGASFFALSSLITRRALLRKHRVTTPSFYQPSNRPSGSVNGAIEAFEALNIATINVASFAMMMTGGMLWVFDISSLKDMRRKVRRGIGVDDGERADQNADEEMEEWLATVLARKEEKVRRKKGDVDSSSQDRTS